MEPTPTPSAATPATTLAPPIAHDEPQTAFEHRDGFALAIAYELVPAVGGNSPLVLPQTRLFVGYQLGRFTLGLTGDLEYATASQTIGAMNESTSVTSLLIGPAVRVAVVRSETGATELLATADIARRTLGGSNDGEPATSSTTTTTMHFGPSLRYWLASGFALAATSGVRADLFSGGGNEVALATSVEIMGVF